MIIPYKYQLSSDNDTENSKRIINITKKYKYCLNKFGASNTNIKSKSNKDNQGYNFQKEVLNWFFKISEIERLKISTINNKWVFQTLHQLYIEQKNKNNLRFIPRINERSILQNFRGKDILLGEPSHFLNYFAFSSEKYELINGYNEEKEKNFLNEIIFFYPLNKTSDLKNKSIGDYDLNYLMKYHYPIFALSESVLNDKEKFKDYFKTLSNNNYFVRPPEIVPQNKQKEESLDNINDNNNIINSFNAINPLNNSIMNLNNKNNNSINEKYNNNKNMIDLPMWAKQQPNSKLCFSVGELFLAFFEQNIFVYYIIYLYDRQFYNSLIEDQQIEEYKNLKKELIGFLSKYKENLLNLLNIDVITKEIYYNSNIEKFVSIKKYKNNLVAKTKFWQEEKGYEEEYGLIKDYFNDINNDIKSMEKIINDISMFNIEQIYSFEEFFLNQVFFNLNKKYESNKNDEFDFMSYSSTKETKKKKKRNKKKKKKQESENDGENINENNNNNKNNNSINDNTINESNKNSNNTIEIKKYISIEEDEELSRIKKDYIKLNSKDDNLCESSGSENNNCDSKPLLPKDDFKQIMIDKENKYNSNNENVIIEDEKKDSNIANDNNNNKNNLNIDNELKNSDDKNNKEELDVKTNTNETSIINSEGENKNDNENNKENEKENSKENDKEKDSKEEDIKEEDNDNDNDNDNKNTKSNNNKNNKENKIINNSKKKKGNNFFLYPTVKKIANDKVNKPPFIMKLNEDILTYNKYLLTILDSLSPIKEHIIETIKSQIKDCFLNDNLLYQLDIYGSFKSHLDIVCSDIDMVFIPQKAKNVNICDLILQLSNYFSSLNKYYKVTPIYTASIPLIKLVIKYDNYLEENKSLLDNYSKLINSSIYKNYPYNNEKEISFVNIDISFPVNNNNKKSKNAPFHQIEFIKNSLSTYVEASIVIRILKRALKLTDMNNSYKGGLSSYTIFLLVASYMKHINKNNINNKHKSNSYGHAFHDVVKYFSKFDFYLNIIDIDNKEGNIYMKRNKKYSSADYENIPIILDPVTGLNAGKSTFRINEVQNVFIALNEELEQLRNLYDKSNKAKENNNKDKENIDEENLIITLLKNVEKKYLNK